MALVLVLVLVSLLALVLPLALVLVLVLVLVLALVFVFGIGIGIISWRLQEGSGSVEHLDGSDKPPILYSPIPGRGRGTGNSLHMNRYKYVALVGKPYLGYTHDRCLRCPVQNEWSETEDVGHRARAHKEQLQVTSTTT